MAQDENSVELNFDMPESCQTENQTNNWKDCANNLSTLIWNTHTWYDNQSIRICKLQCSRKLKGRISNFQWVWDAKFQCESHAPGIIGEARGFKTRRNAMEQAIAQAIEQSIIFGRLTPNDFKCN
jgi:hypothetical protein